MRRQDPKDKRNGKGIKAKTYTFPFVFLEFGKINFETCQKHNIKQPGCSCNYNTAVPGENIKTVWPYYSTGNDEPKQMRNFNFVQENRCKKNDDQNDQKLQNRIFQWQRKIGDT